MPTPLAHGIDIVDLNSFSKAMERGGEKFIARLFTPAEQEYCSSLSKPLASYAARFAAKEAVAKALGTGIGVHASFLEIEVTRDELTRAPSLILHGNALETANEKGISHWLLSLSHTDSMAIASVIGC